MAVMALERVPADIRAEGGVARMASPRIREIMATVTIPVMAKVRSAIRRAQVLEALGVDFIDESRFNAGRRRASRRQTPVQVPFVWGS
jgi:pyridoxal 5'-phosphate synthase pdxS subunit